MNCTSRLFKARKQIYLSIKVINLTTNIIFYTKLTFNDAIIFGVLLARFFVIVLRNFSAIKSL